jgi:glycosyltransferase involved in cell wall biosynthesis
MQIDVASNCGGKRFEKRLDRSGQLPPVFTVVTVVLNNAQDLERTILSVINQSYPDLEYIIIDGGSSDGTLDILRKYEYAVDYWISERDKGVYDAFNKACQLITGQWTIFLGAGDVFHDTEVLATIYETVQYVGTDTEIIYGKVSLINNRNIPVKTLNRSWPQMLGRWRGGRPMLPHHQGVFHRKTILSSEDPFDTSYRIAADSKLIYKSIKSVDPVFASVIVSTVPLDGLSTAPKYVLTTANEIVRVNRELGFTNYPHQVWFYLKAVFKLAIFSFAGDTASKRCIDKYRRFTGRASKWNV